VIETPHRTSKHFPPIPEPRPREETSQAPPPDAQTHKPRHRSETSHHQPKDDRDRLDRQKRIDKEDHHQRERRRDEESRKMVEGMEEELTCPICMNVM